MMDFPDIPDFLRVENRKNLAPEAAAGVSARQPAPARRCRRQRHDLPKTMEPASWALLKQIERDKREKLAAKFKALRERAKR